MPRSSAAVGCAVATFDLEKLQFFDQGYEDPFLFTRWITLKEITKDYNLSKEKQIQKITAWVKDAVNDLENHELLKLLEKNYLDGLSNSIE